MILPWLRGFIGWWSAPLTWTLIAINLFFYFLTSPLAVEVTTLSKHDMQWAARYYSELKGTEVPADPSELLLRGTQALRDPEFYEALGRFESHGDPIGFEKWRTHIAEFRSQLESRPVDLFGLHANSSRPLSWITYQFMHSGALHVIGNLVMLMIFGGALETLTGSTLLVLIYLGGGLAGAFSFLMMSPQTTAPMVGASASLSAVMSFYALFEKRKRVKFFFFLSPSPGYWGEVYLPTLVILPFYFVEDLANYLSTAEEIGTGVAYSAHIGGALFGLATAVILRQAIRRWPQWEQNLYASYSRSRNEAP